MPRTVFVCTATGAFALSEELVAWVGGFVRCARRT
jgi:hypothetical protein